MGRSQIQGVGMEIQLITYVTTLTPCIISLSYVKGSSRKKCRPTVSSNVSLSLKARGLTFYIKTPHINAINIAKKIFKILSGSWEIVVFLSQASPGKQTCSRRTLGHLYEESVSKITALLLQNWLWRQRWQTDAACHTKIYSKIHKI